MLAVYSVIILFATAAGATCGMGGGVIIKPLLDALSPYTSFQINLISALCVFCMAASSLVKHFASKRKSLLINAVAASLGALVGGVCGEFIFDAVTSAARSGLGASADMQIKIIQNAVLALLLVLVLIYMLLREKKGSSAQPLTVTAGNFVKVFAACCALGLISTFLGIGGGPINVCVLCIVLRAGTKDVTVYSLLTVFFAQAAKFIKLAATGGFIENAVFDVNLTWWALAIMAVVAVAGGLIGACANKKMSAKIVSVVYYAVIGLVIALNIYNIIINAVNIVSL